jgi:hypothetical protein
MAKPSRGERVGEPLVNALSKSHDNRGGQAPCWRWDHAFNVVAYAPT